MRVIFQGEEKRHRARMEKEASRIHRETLDHLDESEEGDEFNPDEALLEEILRQEEAEILALLAAREENQDIDEDMDIDDPAPQYPVTTE
jgi:ATP/maltotriose-dependent transcriptional regulator MalT